MNRLRLQLIAVLVLAVALPLIPAAFAARELLRLSLDPLRTADLRSGAEAGLELARAAIEAEKAAWIADLAAGAPAETLRAPDVDCLGLTALGTRAPDARELRDGLRMLRPPVSVVSDSQAWLATEVVGHAGVSTWLARPLPDSLARRARSVERGTRLLGAFHREHDAVLRGFQTTFLVIDLALVGLVLALGLLLATRLTRPLADLAHGIDRVAAGHLETRVPERGGAEIKGLTRRFNAMTVKLAEQQTDLARLERLATWRTMARFLAHEIKNPLTPIQLASEQVRDAYRGDDPAYRRLLEESVGIIREEVAGLRQWVTEFSQFGRLPEVRAAELPAAELAQDLLALYGDGALLARVEPTGATLWCDRDLMKRVLVNLIDNARAAQAGLGRDGPVELRIGVAAGAGVTLRVLDRGPGIAADLRRRVFEPDYTTKRDGMGLGLAIVETIVRQHGGSIAVVDTPGGGATFEIALPRAVPGGSHP